MPDFEKVIVHVLDCEQNTCIMSTACMQELQPEVEKMMQTKASKVFSSSSKKSGKFKESSTRNALSALTSEEDNSVR